MRFDAVCSIETTNGCVACLLACLPHSIRVLVCHMILFVNVCVIWPLCTVFCVCVYRAEWYEYIVAQNTAEQSRNTSDLVFSVHFVNDVLLLWLLFCFFFFISVFSPFCWVSFASCIRPPCHVSAALPCVSCLHLIFRCCSSFFCHTHGFAKEALFRIYGIEFFWFFFILHECMNSRHLGPLLPKMISTLSTALYTYPMNRSPFFRYSISTVKNVQKSNKKKIKLTRNNHVGMSHIQMIKYSFFFFFIEKPICLGTISVKIISADHEQRAM